METALNNKAYISVQNISLFYKQNEIIISDLSFNVASNECFCILGPNGSGKSTILNAVINQIIPKSGVIKFVQENPVIAYLNQDYRQSNLLWESIIENITFPLIFQDLSIKDRYELGNNMIEKLLLEVKPNEKVYTLSGGQQQLISIGGAIVSNPNFMICDEPLSAVDITHSLNALKQLELSRLQREFPILWVSHNIDEALIVSDKIGLLSKSKKKFYKIISNPLPYPRKIEDLASVEATNLKNEIIAFLHKETIN